MSDDGRVTVIGRDAADRAMGPPGHRRPDHRRRRARRGRPTSTGRLARAGLLGHPDQRPARRLVLRPDPDRRAGPRDRAGPGRDRHGPALPDPDHRAGRGPQARPPDDRRRLRGRPRGRPPGRRHPPGRPLPLAPGRRLPRAPTRSRRSGTPTGTLFQSLQDASRRPDRDRSPWPRSGRGRSRFIERAAAAGRRRRDRPLGGRPGDDPPRRRRRRGEAEHPPGQRHRRDPAEAPEPDLGAGGRRPPGRLADRRRPPPRRRRTCGSSSGRRRPIGWSSSATPARWPACRRGVMGPWAVEASGRVVVAGTPYLAGANRPLTDGVDRLIRPSGSRRPRRSPAATARPGPAARPARAPARPGPACRPT